MGTHPDEQGRQHRNSYFKTVLPCDPGKQKLPEEEGYLIWETGRKGGGGRLLTRRNLLSHVMKRTPRSHTCTQRVIRARAHSQENIAWDATRAGVPRASRPTVTTESGLFSYV